MCSSDLRATALYRHALGLGAAASARSASACARSCWCCALACPGAGGAVPGRAFCQLLELRLYSCTCRLTYLVSQLSVHAVQLYSCTL